MPVRGESAIVIGGSVVGMMAAGVLSEHFDQVTVFDADQLLPGQNNRRGVPQSHHLHGLYRVGISRLDEIFGDFTGAMRDNGAAYIDPARETAWFFPEGWTRRSPSDLRGLQASRWTIENVIRDLARGIENITFRHGRITGLAARSRRIVGVRVHDESSGTEQVVEGDLVIDCSGRGSRAPQWLEDAGFVPPEDSIVEPFLGYATVHCEIPEDAWPGDMRVIAAPPFPGTPTRGGYIVPEEGGLVGIMAVGTAKDYPPADQEGFTEFLRTARTPVMHEMWLQAKAQSELKATRTSVNRLRRWDEVLERPLGFAPLGDAVAVFNPVYGQGISAGAMQAAALASRLRESDQIDDANRHLFDDVMAACAVPWASATGTDIGLPSTQVRGRPLPPEDPAGAEFGMHIRALTTTDSYVAQEFARAMGDMRPDLLDTPEIRRRVELRAAQEQPPVGDVSRPPQWADTEPPRPDGDLEDTSSRCLRRMRPPA